MAGLMSDDGGADYLALYEGLGIAGDVISWILGILIVIVLIGLPVIVSIEVLFLNVPTFQSTIDRMMEENKTANKIIGTCLRDAKRAIYRANTSETGQSANGIYFGIKLKTVFITFVIIGIVLGPGVILVNFLVDRVKDLLSLI